MAKKYRKKPVVIEAVQFDGTEESVRDSMHDSLKGATPMAQGAKMPWQPEAMGKYEALGRAIGALVDVKNAQYGNAFHKTGKILAILYPEGVTPEQYDDMLAVVRVLDKLFRVANGKQGNEDPFKDIAGYGLLGMEE